MAQATSIAWTEATWNPVTGCDKVSPGCAHCYAETFAERWRGIPGHPYEQGFDVRLWPNRLEIPARWRRPRMVFVNSMSDLFHEQIPDEYIARVFGAMAAAPQHTFQVLTKRPDRMLTLLTHPGFENTMRRASGQLGHELPLPNVWLGVSIENRRFVSRADVLRQVPAVVRFISAEPLLGSLLDIRPCEHRDRCRVDNEDCMCEAEGGDGTINHGIDLDCIHWLIVGGESGPRCRPMRLEWARELREACEMYGTAFFVKQFGGARPGTALEDLPADLRIREFPTTPRGSA